MNTYFEGIYIPTIVFIVYGIIEILKLTISNESKIKSYYPIIAGGVGMILGIIGFVCDPMLLGTENVLISAGVGMISGLSATGTNQLVKKIVGVVSLRNFVEPVNESVDSEDINDHDKIIDNYYRDYDCSGDGVEDYCYCTYCEDYYSDEKTISENHCAHLDDGNVKASDDEVCLYKCNDTTCANAEGEKDKLNIRDTSEKNNGKKEKSFEYYSDNEYKNELI